MSENLISDPVDQPLAYEIGQTVTRFPAKTVPFTPAVNPAGTKPFPALPEAPETGKLPTETALPKAHHPTPSSVSIAAVPPLLPSAPTPYLAFQISDVQPTSGLRTASDPDEPTDSGALATVKPASAAKTVGISQEESVLRAIWVRVDPVEKPSQSANPPQSREKRPEPGMSDSATAPAIPVSQPTAKEPALNPLSAEPLTRTELAKSEPAAPTTERAKPGPELSPANPAVAGTATVEAKPRALGKDLPTDLPTDRPTGAQPFDPAVLPIATPTDRLTSSPRPEAASASTPSSPQTPSPQTQIAQAVGTAGEQSTEITLSPEELGHVRIDMRSDGDRMVMTISAERQDTLDLLRRHADELAAEMRAAGQAGVSLSFGRWSGSGFGSAPDGKPQGAPSDPRPAPEKVPALTPTFRPAISASGLYLRI